MFILNCPRRRRESQFAAANLTPAFSHRRFEIFERLRAEKFAVCLRARATVLAELARAGHRSLDGDALGDGNDAWQSMRVPEHVIVARGGSSGSNGKGALGSASEGDADDEHGHGNGVRVALSKVLKLCAKPVSVTLLLSIFQQFSMVLFPLICLIHSVPHIHIFSS